MPQSQSRRAAGRFGTCRQCRRPCRRCGRGRGGDRRRCKHRTLDRLEAVEVPGLHWAARASFEGRNVRDGGGEGVARVSRWRTARWDDEEAVAPVVELAGLGTVRDGQEGGRIEVGGCELVVGGRECAVDRAAQARRGRRDDGVASL